MYATGPPGPGRPDEQAAANRPAPAEPIRDIAADRAEECVDPLELPEHEAPALLTSDAWNVPHYRGFHRRQHLAVEIVQERDGHQKNDHEPRRADQRGWR